MHTRTVATRAQHVSSVLEWRLVLERSLQLVTTYFISYRVAVGACTYVATRAQHVSSVLEWRLVLARTLQLVTTCFISARVAVGA